MKDLTKHIAIVFISITLISCTSTANKTTSTQTIERTISTEDNCLKSTRDSLKNKTFLPLPRDYWPNASIICANPDKFDLNKIAQLHKTLKEKGYYDSGFFVTSNSATHFLEVSIILNGDESKMGCVDDKFDEFSKSKTKELKDVPEALKYKMAARLCSKQGL